MGTSIIVLLVIYFLAVVALSTIKSSYVPGRAIYLFRALFPSWRFFEDLVDVPVLYFRVSSDGTDFGPWVPSFEKIERNWQSILLNPQGNLLFAYHGLLHQLENDIEEVDESKAEEFVDSVSYKLVKNLVLTQVPTNSHFQFKVSSVRQGKPEHAVDVLFSLVHEAV